MGQVFLAEQIRLRRQVAIKLVYLDMKSDVPPGRAEPAEELTREAEALMALEHPNILSLYDAGRDGDTAYLVMPYIPEGSLQEALRPGPRQQLQLPLPPGEALIYLEQAAAALQYAHDRSFVHRDVKPANFLIRSLTRSRSVRGRAAKRLHLFLADFGLSKFLAYSTNTTHLAGTPTYMAPEQFQGRASPASDQYSLAILFFYLLTGDLPYRGSPVELMFHHLNDAPPSPAARVEGIPESLASVVQRGMAKTPEERYPSVASMAEAAREALIAAGMMPSQDSFPAIAAVRPPDLQSAKPEDRQQNSLAADTSAPASLETPPADANTTDELATSKAPLDVPPPDAPARPAESSLPTLPVKHGESSLPTLPGQKHHRPARPPRRERPSSERPSRRGSTIALAALAAIILLGAVFGAAALLHIGPFQASAPAAQSPQKPSAGTTAAPGQTPTPTTPTPVPASTLLNNILAHSPAYTVDLTQGDAQWDGPTPINRSAFHELRTPSGAVIFQDAIISFNAHRFPTPLALAVDLQAPSDQEFYILLDTTNGSAHLYYRLLLTNSAPPQAAHSSNNKTFTTDGSGASTNTTWTDGGKHTLMLVLDGTRLLFYLDRQPLVDTTIPQPYPTARLTLATLNQATITGISQYSVPQTG